MTTAPKGQAENTPVYFVYDGWNRVAGISATATPDGDFADTGEVQYEYDGLNRRIQKDFAGGTTNDEAVYYNENWQELELRKNNQSKAYTQFVWDQRFIDTPIVRYRDADNSTVTGGLGTEEVLYATYDGNYNITGLVQENQTFVERYVYTPYDDVTVLTGTFAARASSNYDWNRLHQGLQRDTESGVIQNRGRQTLHPTLGLFGQRDPEGTAYRDGMNLGQYVRSNPVRYVDPSGLAAGNAGQCDKIRRKIDNIKKDIRDRQTELKHDWSKLRESAPGEPLSKSRDGHRQIIKELEGHLDKWVKMLADFCSDDEPPCEPKPIPQPVDVPFKLPRLDPVTERRLVDNTGAAAAVGAGILAILGGIAVVLGG